MVRVETMADQKMPHLIYVEVNDQTLVLRKLEATELRDKLIKILEEK